MLHGVFLSVLVLGTVIYDSGFGSPPGDQPFLFYADNGPLNGGMVTQKTETDGVRIATDLSISAGFASHFPLLNIAKSDEFPALDREAGFQLQIALQLESEQHISDDRAGLSLILISNDLRGIEVAFWENEIWVQTDEPLFTHAEGVAFDTTSAGADYRVSVWADTYRVYSDDSLLLEGPLRDYSAQGTPYDIPGFFFVGDNTSRAGSVTHIGHIELGPVPLRAGDADQNLVFDQLDLIRVQQAGKYRTGRTASWGEGDWETTEGGFLGEPAPGDGLFDQADVVAALATANYLNGPYSAFAMRSPIPEPDAFVLIITGLMFVMTSDAKRMRGHHAGRAQ